MVLAKKRNTELQVTAQKLVDSANKKAKDAVKRICSCPKSISDPMYHEKNLKDILEKEVLKQNGKIKQIEEKLKLLN